MASNTKPLPGPDYGSKLQNLEVIGAQSINYQNQSNRFDNYLEANQSQNNAVDMSDSIATSKLADEFLCESSMTQQELQKYTGTHKP